jgi:hypothetical protein
MQSARTRVSSQEIERVTLDLLYERKPETTICPSEVARALAADEWRSLMPAVRDVAARLSASGRLTVTRGGRGGFCSRSWGPNSVRPTRRIRAWRPGGLAELTSVDAGCDPNGTPKANNAVVSQLGYGGSSSSGEPCPIRKNIKARALPDTYEFPLLCCMPLYQFHLLFKPPSILRTQEAEGVARRADRARNAGPHHQVEVIRIPLVDERMRNERSKASLRALGKGDALRGAGERKIVAISARSATD